MVKFNRRPGTQLLVTDVWRGRLWSAVPHRVVRWTSREQITYTRRGTPAAFASSRGIPGREGFSRADGKMEALRTCVYNVVEVQVKVLDALHFFTADSWARINLGWDATGVFHGWYVNFEMPPVLTTTGIRTMDLILDATIDPARHWRWKDRDETDRAIAEGILDPTVLHILEQQAHAIRAQLAAGEGPFDPHWVDWSPPTDWTLPVLPADFAPGGTAWITT